MFGRTPDDVKDEQGDEEDALAGIDDLVKDLIMHVSFSLLNLSND